MEAEQSDLYEVELLAILRSLPTEAQAMLMGAARGLAARCGDQRQSARGGEEAASAAPILH